MNNNDYDIEVDIDAEIETKIVVAMLNNANRRIRELESKDASEYLKIRIAELEKQNAKQSLAIAYLMQVVGSVSDKMHENMIDVQIKAETILDNIISLTPAN